jgi:hypothetical protein
MYQFNGVSETVKELVAEVIADGGTVDEECVTIWIEEIIESLNKEDTLNIAIYLLKNGNNLSNLLKVYSYADERFEEAMECQRG